MIKYNLNCKVCNNNFDSWFASSKEYEKIKKLNLLSCENCGSTKIDKSLMAPNLSNTKKNLKLSTTNKFNKIKNKIIKYQKFIKENFDYVGDNFTYEARSIHYSNKKRKKGIYGKANLKDIKELSEEGIDTALVPWINDKEN